MENNPSNPILGVKGQWPVKTVPVAALIPCPDNPRTITPENYARLRDKIRRLGFNAPIVVAHDLRVIGGHQRLKVITELGWKETTVSICPYEMTDLEYREALIENNVSDGDWDIEALKDDWQEFPLEEWGVDPETVWQSKAPEGVVGTNVRREWEGMPQFAQEDKTAFRSLIVHFKDQAAVDAFAKLLSQPITEKTRMLWHPVIEIERYMDKIYAQS